MKLWWIIILCLILVVLVSGRCWTYTINTWLVYFGKDATVVLWQGMVLACIPAVGQASIGLAVFTWLLMMFLV